VLVARLSEAQLADQVQRGGVVQADAGPADAPL